MTFFVICGIVGFVLLLISMFSGHDADMHSMDHGSMGGDSGDSGVSIFSFRTIIVFLTAFGAVGSICTYYKVDMLYSSLGGIGAGIVFGFISWWMMNFATKQQASSVVNVKDMIGCDAIVHVPIPVDGVGEVAIEISGQRKYMPARASNLKSAIPVHSQVKITEDMAGGVMVQLKIQ